LLGRHSWRSGKTLCLYRHSWHGNQAYPKADGFVFQAFCEGRGESFLPADPATIRAFIEHEVKAGKKPATVRRHIATIGRTHIGAGLLNPCSGEAVRLALKKMGRETSARQAQARALG
jgi:site-specific recombinase XerD